MKATTGIFHEPSGRTFLPGDELPPEILAESPALLHLATEEGLGPTEPRSEALEAVATAEDSPEANPEAEEG